MNNESFYFLHHGQTDWNDQGLLMGQQDIPLNDRGRHQANEAGKILAGLTVATLCYSPLARAKETAQIVVSHCPCSLFPIDGLKERCWGKLEGRVITTEELSKEEQQTSDGAESQDSFKKRVLNALQNAASHPEPILLVSHSGVFDIICSEMKLSPPFLSNTCVAHFFQELGKWRVEIIKH